VNVSTAKSSRARWAGAAVLQPCADGESWIGRPFMAAKGRPDILIVPGGGSRRPASIESVRNREHFMKMAGREVFKFAVKQCLQMIRRELKLHGLAMDDIRYLVLHQANQRILDAVAERLKISNGKVFSNIERVGNTSSASVPIALDELNRRGLIARGDLLLLCAFGGGLTWASVVVKW